MVEQVYRHGEVGEAVNTEHSKKPAHHYMNAHHEMINHIVDKVSNTSNYYENTSNTVGNYVEKDRSIRYEET